MLVRDIMTAEPASVSFNASLGEVADLLYEMDVRHIPVVDGDELVGMISDRDIRASSSPTAVELEYPETTSWENQKVNTVMSSGVLSVAPDDPVSDVIQLMIDQKLSAVPVADDHDGVLVGIVSYIDILSAVQDVLD